MCNVPLVSGHPIAREYMMSFRCWPALNVESDGLEPHSSFHQSTQAVRALLPLMSMWARILAAASSTVSRVLQRVKRTRFGSGSSL